MADGRRRNGEFISSTGQRFLRAEDWPLQDRGPGPKILSTLKGSNLHRVHLLGWAVFTG